ncbi:MAG: hypothetical protein A07HB70_00597 [uncultured archaeon A07HB70]|nr:MAG: hypothetical protein A07HB70_00597 [uncultured archaeon A07HB70]
MSLPADAGLAGATLGSFANWLGAAGDGGWPLALSGRVDSVL